MASDEKRWLIKSIGTVLLPEFQRQGFEVIPLFGDDLRSGEIRSAFPFGRLRRAVPNGFDLVEIQVFKRGQAAFRLNVGFAPLNGIEHFVGGHITPEDIWVGYLEQFFEVYMCPAFRIWFKVWRWPSRVVTESDFDELTSSVVKLIPEVELALSDSKCGPHVRRVG